MALLVSSQKEEDSELQAKAIAACQAVSEMPESDGCTYGASPPQCLPVLRGKMQMLLGMHDFIRRSSETSNSVSQAYNVLFANTSC